MKRPPLDTPPRFAIGAGEMRCTRFHGERHDDGLTIHRHARFWGAITARLHEVGIRW